MLWVVLFSLSVQHADMVWLKNERAIGVRRLYRWKCISDKQSPLSDGYFIREPIVVSRYL